MVQTRTEGPPLDVGNPPVDMSRAGAVTAFVPDPNRWWARGFGGMFLAGGLAHLLLVGLEPGAYDGFADASYWPFITHAWRSVLVPNVHYLITVLAVFELAVGALILGRRYRLSGVIAAAAFNASLMLFGWGFLAWSLPVLTLLALFARRELAVRDRAPRQTDR